MKRHIIFLAICSVYTIAVFSQINTGETFNLSAPDSGNKTYIARESITLSPGFRYTATSENNFNAKIDKTLLFPPTEGKYINENGIIVNSAYEGAVVGSVAGQLDVSPTGAATYTIPIECPEGIQGIQPNLALVYNSQTGNSILGWGWNLSGISAITRTGKDYYHDSSAASVKLNVMDNLMLDGQRLYLISGTHFSANAEYRTEIESFSKIIYKYIDGYMGFEVTTKGGSKMEYGSSTDSYIEAQGSNVPLQWLLKKVSDRNGNYLNYEYYENTSNGECRLSKIKYTGNSAANLLPFSAIEFMYKARTDTITNYIAGKLIMEPKLLDYILVKTNNQILKKYSITYSTEGLYSQITSITEELSDGARYKPIKICWKDESVIYSKTGEEDSYLGLFEHITDLNPIFADFNGDGRRDFITVKDKVVKLYINYDFSGISFPKKTEFTVYGDNYKAVIPADLNGDGLMDIIGVTHAPNNTYRYNYYFFDGNSFSGVSGGFNTTVADNDYVIGDFNGDGKHEILIKSTEKLYDGTGTVIGSGGITDWGDELFSTFPNCLNLFDVTGNGKTNICIRTGNTGYVYEFNGSTFELLFSTSELSNKQDIYPGDYNNDGKIDLFVIKSNSSYGPYGYETFWLLSTGNSFVKKILPRLTLSEKTLKGFGGDFNLDGKYDFALVEYESRGISFYVKFKIGINNGSGFDFVSYTSNMPLNEREDWQKLDCADYDGDGRYDFTYHKYSDVWMNKSFDDTFFARIKSISNGFETHYVDYLPVTSRYIYNTEEQYSVNFPVTKTLFPFYVVQRLYDNIYYSISYYYKNIRTHKQGKGFLGFEKISATNSRNNQTVSSIYDYNHTYFNVYPAKQIVSVNTGNTTDTVSASVFSNNIIYFGGKRVFPYQSGQISTNYLTGLTTDVSIHNYDIYGNPDSVRTIRGNHTETKIFKYTDNGSWCNYLPQKITVKQQWDNDIITRISTFGYDTKGNIINDTIDVGDVNQYITSYSNYDAFGNPQKITTSANGVSRSQTLTYTPSGRFVKTRTNDLLNETITYHYYEERGLLTAETSRLGWISYGYDACNRLVETHYPDGTKSVNTLLWAANRSDKPLGAKYYSYSETSGESPLTVWYDALGREIRSESYGLNQKKIQISTEYNTKGQVSTVWGPYFENETSINATDYLYDSYGRIKKITDVEGITTYTYNGLTTTVTTPSGSSSTTVNSAGLTTSQTTNGKSVAFTHYANGQVKTATPQGGTAITMEYNLQGKRTSLVDPDAGTVKSKYDGWGQLLVDSQYVHSKTTPVVTTYNYTQAGLLNYMQRVGKQTQRTDYIYDSLNRLKTVRIAGQHSQTYYYDNFDRIIQSVDSITNSTVFKRSTEFDQLGRVYKQIYPDGFTVSNIYDRNGYLTHVKKFDDNSLLWQAKESNARGQLTKTQQGSKETIYSFNAKGFPVSIVTAGITNLSYVFNAKGNLSSRKDGISIYKDSMYYDSMNRLTNWHIYQGSTITQSNSLSFNATTGNIQSKTGISTAMTYGENGKPHALTSLDPVSSYVPAGQTLTYTDFRKIKTVSHNGTSYSLVYGTDEQRIKSTHTKSGTTTSKYYLGDYEEETTGSTTRKIHYISGGNGLAAVYITSNGTGQLYYAHTDCLGSLVALSRPDGTVAERYAYDPWGNRLNPTDWRYADSRTSFILNRGYTMHEHLDDLGLINMNGRVYDAKLGMFLSPDPYIQAPGNWLNYNRYGYALNNPFKYIDPDGEFFHLIIGAVIGGVLNWATHGFKFNAKGLGYFGVGALAGALGAGIGAGISSILPIAGQASGGFAAGFWGTNAATTATSSFVSGALVGGSSGLASGFTTGFGNALVDGKNFGQALGQGGIYGAIGMGSGALIGGIVGGISAIRDGREFWDGARMIDEQSLANQNLPLVQQRGDMNCGPATGESTTGVSQDRYRAIIGGNPDNDPLTIAQLNDAIQSETGRNVKVQPFNTLPTDKTGAEQLAGYMHKGNNFYLGSTTPGQPIGHATALNSVIVRTFQKISGDLYYKVFYQAMDPARGVYRIIGANSMRVVVRIYP